VEWQTPRTAYPDSQRPAELGFESIWKCPGDTNLIGIEEASYASQTEHTDDKCSEQHSTPSRREVGVLFRSEDSKNIVIFVDWFAVVTSLLLVPPVAVGVTELSLDGGRVDVPAIL